MTSVQVSIGVAVKLQSVVSVCKQPRDQAFMFSTEYKL